MRDFDHYLLTRFNVKVEGWETTRKGTKVLTDDWLSHRFELFEKYCLPSVQNQSVVNFKWCIFFDTDTPERFKFKINEIASRDQFIEVFYVNNETEIVPSFLEHTSGSSSEFIITSRLDNDDLIHQDFIKTIQNLFQARNNQVIDLTRGFQMKLEGNRATFCDYHNQFNPFISLVENRNSVKTVLSREHKEWKLMKDYSEFKSSALWIEFIHENNKLNHINLSLYRSSARLLDFNLTGTKNQPWIKIFSWNVFNLLKKTYRLVR